MQGGPDARARWWWGALGRGGGGRDAVREGGLGEPGQGGGPVLSESNTLSPMGCRCPLLCIFGEWGWSSPTRASGVTGSGGRSPMPYLWPQRSCVQQAGGPGGFKLWEPPCSELLPSPSSWGTLPMGGPGWGLRSLTSCFHRHLAQWRGWFRVRCQLRVGIE